MQQITSMDDLLAALDLRDIRYQELSGRRTATPTPKEPVKIEVPMNLQVVWNDDQQGFVVIYKTEIKLPQAHLVIAVSVHFAMGDPGEIEEGVMEDFLGDTVFELAYPYIRQAASALCSQLRISPVIMLPLIKADVGHKLSKHEDSSETSAASKG